MHAEPDKLSESARSILIDRSREVFFSAVSSWEIAIKHTLGRLVLPEPPRMRYSVVKGASVKDILLRWLPRVFTNTLAIERE